MLPLMLPLRPPTPAPSGLWRRFAMEEGVLALARLVCAFDIALDPAHHPAGRPLELTTGLTMNPTGGIWVQLRPRMGS